MDLDSQVAELLRQPPPGVQEPYFAEATQGLGVEVRLDAGEGRGRGVFATQVFCEGQLLWSEPPLAGMQHSANRRLARVCGHCFRFVGGVDLQLSLQLAAAAEGAAAEDEAPAKPDEETIAALASGALALPHAGEFCGPPPVACPGGCAEEWYCSSTCAHTAWTTYHCLLCTGAEASGSSSSSSAPASEWGPARRAPRTQRALSELLALADETNDILRLAAKVVAATLLAAAAAVHHQQQQQQQHIAGAPGTSSSTSQAAALAGASASERWDALCAAWRPWGVGHKALWWEAAGAAAGPEAARDMRDLAAEALRLLTVAMPPELGAAFPAVLSLSVWGSIIGMFELNNLALFVSCPVLPWLRFLESRKEPECEEALKVAARYTDALGEEVAGCEGTAFYRLHSCCNHSCLPNAHAFKHDDDMDGSAVIRVLRDIAPGEEITMSYIDEDAPLAERREQLTDWGFECKCDKCEAEALAEELGSGGL